MKYFFQYVLGMKDKTNKKAVLGTVFHRVMQVLADKKIAQINKKKKLSNDDIQDLTFDECDDIDYVTNLCFKYYKKHEEDVDLTAKDLIDPSKSFKDFITPGHLFPLIARDGGILESCPPIQRFADK